MMAIKMKWLGRKYFLHIYLLLLGAGEGLFAKVDIDGGVVVSFYSGVRIPHEMVECWCVKLIMWFVGCMYGMVCFVILYV